MEYDNLEFDKTILMSFAEHKTPTIICSNDTQINKVYAKIKNLCTIDEHGCWYKGFVKILFSNAVKNNYIMIIADNFCRSFYVS